MWQWIKDHEALEIWLAGVSVAISIGGLLVVTWLIVRLPTDYFTHRRPPHGLWPERHPALRMLGLTLKNAAGALLLLAGLIMLVTPGPGVVSILVGLSLLDLPGKRALERWIVGHKSVLQAINVMRARANHPPLEPPADE